MQRLHLLHFLILKQISYTYAAYTDGNCFTYVCTLLFSESFSNIFATWFLYQATLQKPLLCPVVS